MKTILDKERAIFHELLTDFVYSSLLLEKAEKVRDLLEKQQFSEALLFLGENRPYVGQEHDEVALLQAVIALCEARYQEALKLVGATLPFVALDRTRSAMAHWLGAVALEGLGRSEDALYWCSLAADQASSPKARPLQIGILCFWAETLAKNGQSDQGSARVQLALRRARLPHELFHAHLTAARLWWQLDQEKAKYHLELAQSLANTPARRLLATKANLIPRPKELTGRRTPVRVRMLSGLALEVGLVRISAARCPRAALLLAYLVQNDGETIAEIAEQILPPDTSQKGVDKARSDRAARVRQHLTQARRLLGDPAGVVCKGGRLWLGQQYDWESDLRIAVLAGTFDVGQVLPIIACPWLEELSFTLNSPSA